MITLIGTGHVFNLSAALLNIFDEKQPEILCIELDKQRYNAMMLKQSDPEKYEEASKGQPAIYKLLARFQDGMANEYGVQAGDEMLTATNYAQSHQLPLAFIDMNAQNLFSRMLKEMTIREKLSIMFSGIAGLFVSKKRVEKELVTIEQNFDAYIEQIGKKFPTIKRVLINERNEHMVNQIIKADEEHKKIVAVMGDGHIPGISESLKSKGLDFETIRLGDLRKEANADVDNVNGSFSFECRQE